MNQGRAGHGIALVDGCLYAIGGQDGGNYLQTVERLNLAEHATAWALFTITGLSARFNPMVCRLSANEILVAGGNNFEYLADALVIDIKNRRASTVASSRFGFICYA